MDPITTLLIKYGSYGLIAVLCLTIRKLYADKQLCDREKDQLYERIIEICSE